MRSQSSPLPNVGRCRTVRLQAGDGRGRGQALAAAKRQEVETIAHNERQRIYFEYLERRQEREREQVARAGEEAKRAAIAARPISRDNAYLVYKEAADLERLRFEIREPGLEFQEWIDAGQPAVHQTRVAKGSSDLRSVG